MQMRPPLTHEKNPEMEGADYLNKFAIKQIQTFMSYHYLLQIVLYLRVLHSTLTH